jgi:S-adenosylmethionine decarboxylase
VSTAIGAGVGRSFAAPAPAPAVAEGCEWVVEATRCDASALRDPEILAALFDAIVRDLALHPVAPTVWHRFPEPGGVTGICVLAESHLTVHTFPEHGSLCLNLFCCRPREDWPFETRLGEQFGAAAVHVRRLARPYGPGPLPSTGSGQAT